jgi:hypothetical protein
LTLKLDAHIIARAKDYAKEKNTSLSQLIESYLSFVTAAKATNTTAVTPLVKSLSGIIELPKNYDYKENYKGHLLKKYTK